MAIDLIELEGKRFNMLVIESSLRLEYGNKGLVRIFCNCSCDCGKSCRAAYTQIKNGKTKSCGCLKGVKGSVSHELQDIFVNAKSRCENKNHKGYPRWGGRGIKFMFKDVFDMANALVVKRPSKSHSVDRIDNDGNYEHGNVKWSTQSEQCRNTRRNLIFNYNGRDMCLAEIVSGSNLKYGTVLARVKRGMSIEEAMSKTVRK